MTDFGPWLRPTLLGPFLSTMGVVTLAHLVLGDHAADQVLFTGHVFDSWVVSMFVAAIVSCGLVVNLIVADVTLLWLKWRKLPTGGGAWMSALLAPIALHFAMQLFSGVPETMLDAVLAIVLPFPIAAFVIRFVFGSKP